MKRLIMAGALALLAFATGPVAAEENAAQKAVEAAKQYSGTALTATFEAGLGAAGSTNFQQS